MTEPTRKLSEQEIDQLIAAARAEKISAIDITKEMIDGIENVLEQIWVKYTNNGQAEENLVALQAAMMGALGHSARRIIDSLPFIFFAHKARLRSLIIDIINNKDTPMNGEDT